MISDVSQPTPAVCIAPIPITAPVIAPTIIPRLIGEARLVGGTTSGVAALLMDAVLPGLNTTAARAGTG
jgi:hypothetical protein